MRCGNLALDGPLVVKHWGCCLRFRDGDSRHGAIFAFCSLLRKRFPRHLSKEESGRLDSLLQCIRKCIVERDALVIGGVRLIRVLSTW